MPASTRPSQRSGMTAPRVSAAPKSFSEMGSCGSGACGGRCRHSTSDATPASRCTAGRRTRRTGRATRSWPAALRRSPTPIAERRLPGAARRQAPTISFAPTSTRWSSSASGTQPTISSSRRGTRGVGLPARSDASGQWPERRNRAVRPRLGPKEGGGRRLRSAVSSAAERARQGCFYPMARRCSPIHPAADRKPSRKPTGYERISGAFFSPISPSYGVACLRYSIPPPVRRRTPYRERR
jgi:hypothetical protein